MRRLTSALAVLVVAMAASVAHAGTAEVVMDEPGVREQNSSASDGYLVWSADSAAKPFRYHTYVQAGAGAPVRVDPPGTQSTGGAIDGTTVVYEEDVRGDSDLWFFDASTLVRSAVPDGVNTAKYEYRPSLSGDWLLFTRNNTNRVRIRDAWTMVVLFNLMDGTTIVLEKLPFRSTYLVGDQVNGDWATFESCEYRRGRYFDCQVFRYQISGEALVEMPNPGVQQYAGAVSGDGTVYLVRTRNRNQWRCGSHTKIVRFPVGGPKALIATLPDGRDALTTSALDEMDGSTTLYFDRTRCRNGQSGIYRIPNAEGAGPP